MNNAATLGTLRRLFESPHELGHLLGFKKLNTAHSEWINMFLNVPRSGEAVLQAHRNSYKTTSGLVALAMLFLIYPNLRILIVRKTVDNAESLIKAMMKIFESDIMRLLCHSIYNKPGFETEKWSKTGVRLSCKTSITPEESIEACGVGTSKTGRHYDYIWCDDIITPEDRESPAERERTKSTVRELSNIVTTTGSIMYTGTPWHEDDAFCILPKAKKYPLGSIHIDDIDDAWIEKMKSRTTKVLWSINYNLVHIEDSDRIGAFSTCPEFSTPYTVAWIDSSFSDRRKSDRTAVAIVGFAPERGKSKDEFEIQFIGKSWDRSISDPGTIRELLLFLDEYQPVETCMESQLAETTSLMIGRLQQEEEALGLSTRNHFTYLHQTKNKHEKIHLYVAANKWRIRALESCDEAFLRRVSKYSKGVDHDDEADALADAILLWQTSKALQIYIREYESYKIQEGIT